MNGSWRYFPCAVVMGYDVRALRHSAASANWRLNNELMIIDWSTIGDSQLHSYTPGVATFLCILHVVLNVTKKIEFKTRSTEATRRHRR